MACTHCVACTGFVSSALPYSACNHSLRKQLSEQFGVARMNPGTVQPPVDDEMLERETCFRQNSSPGSLSNLNHSPAVLNCTTGPDGCRRLSSAPTPHVAEHNNLIKSSEGSVAASSSPLYVFTYL